jgi:hypothetical protein
MPGATLATVAPAVRGADVLMVDDASRIRPGQMVILEVDNAVNRRLLKEMAGDVAGADTYNWAVDGKRISTPTALDDLQTWRWPVFVT